MGARFHSLWQQIKQHPFIVAGIIVVVFALTVFSVTVIKFGWDWTGFNGGEGKITITSTSKGTTIAKELQPAKSLWDWLGLLAVLTIPVVVGLGAAWFTAQQGKVSDRENKDNQLEAALQAYIDKLSELLLHEKLRTSAKEDEVRKIARLRTFTILPRLDANRKRSVLQFIYESGLIKKAGEDKYIINLIEADFSGANLIEAYMVEADLIRVNLSGADLRRATLLSVNLGGANLSGANLSGANLSGANLSQADFRNANLTGAIFYKANLGGAMITEEQLKEAKVLEDTIMPDGSIYGTSLMGHWDW